MLTGILSLVSMEFVALRVCVELVMSVFCAVASSPVPTIDPCIPRAKRPPPYLEYFLQWINDRIDRMCIELAPWISVRRRHNRSTQRSSHSPCSQQLRHPPWRMLNTCYSWWHDFFFTKWNHSSWRERHRKRNCPMWQRRHRTRIIALSAISIGVSALAATAQRSNQAVFDSDSFDVLVDGGATSCISNSLSDFVKPPKASPVRVKGFNGTTSPTRVGTVAWNLLDDSGHKRTLRIQNTYYVPACPLRILSPQHHSQQTNDLRGTCSTNFGDQVIFVWNRGNYRVTVPLSPSNNVGILRSAPGHKVSLASWVPTKSPPSFAAQLSPTMKPMCAALPTTMTPMILCLQLTV